MTQIEELIGEYLDLKRLTGKTEEGTKEAITKELAKKESVPINELIKVYHILNHVGLSDVANQVEETLVGKVEKTERDDWINHQICGDFPKIDFRCLVFCCSPKKDCPFRKIALRSVGLNDEDYIKIKQELAEHMLSE